MHLLTVMKASGVQTGLIFTTAHRSSRAPLGRWNRSRVFGLYRLASVSVCTWVHISFRICRYSSCNPAALQHDAGTLWKDQSAAGELHPSHGQKTVLSERAREKPQICVFRLLAGASDWDPWTAHSSGARLSEGVSGTTPDPDRP